jgi:hypothetical protein
MLTRVRGGESGGGGEGRNLSGAGVSRIDATAIHAVEGLLDHFAAHKVTPFILHLKEGPYKTLDRAGVVAKIGVRHFFKDEDVAQRAAVRLLRRSITHDDV